MLADLRSQLSSTSFFGIAPPLWLSLAKPVILVVFNIYDYYQLLKKDEFSLMCYFNYGFIKKLSIKPT